MQSPATDTARAYGAYVASHSRRETPEHVLDAARLCFADWLACALGARGEDAGRIVRETAAAWSGPGRSTVLYGNPGAAPLAALSNGTLAHCLDFDDTHMPSITHTSAPVWAATLALGESRGATEMQMLRAYIAGFETATRTGKGLGQAVTARGLHSTGVWGRIGAAAAGSALLGLDEGRTQHALATAATQAGGLAASFGTMAKPFHAGKAAMDGLLAAELASRGFEGQPAVIGPDGGLDRAIIQDGSLKLPVPSFEDWELLSNSFKPYAACHLVHPAVDAVRATGLRAAEVRTVRAFVSPLAMQITGNASGRPDSPLAAKFDLKYCLGMAFAGHVLSARDFMEPWRADAAVAEIAARISPAVDTSKSVAQARLEVDTIDGRSIAIDIAAGKGHPGNPMTWVDMRAKFEGLVEPHFGNSASELFDLARSFGSGRNLSRLQEIVTV
jgi:2-methylcitrate dehydratase PrpD